MRRHWKDGTRAVVFDPLDFIARLAALVPRPKAAIGRRYRRQDEAGTPYCVTIDGDTLSDDVVTVGHRDSMQQERVKSGEIRDYILEQMRSWKRPQRD